MADDASKKSEAASAKAQQGTDAALETIGQYRGKAQEQGISALRGAQDRYQSAKNTAAQKTGETANVTGQKKNTIAVGIFFSLLRVSISPFLPDITALSFSRSLEPFLFRSFIAS